MPFVQAKCENCAGILTVDSDLKAAICPHCGVPYVVQDYVNYYNSYTKVDHLSANIVNVLNEDSSEGLINAAKAYIKLGDYEQAKEYYIKATKIAPQNYNAWIGLIEAKTRNYSKRITSEKELCELDNIARSVMVLSDCDEKDNLLSAYRKYEDSERKKNEQDIKKYHEELDYISSRTQKIEAELTDFFPNFNIAIANQNKYVDCTGQCGSVSIRLFVLGILWLIFPVFTAVAIMVHRIVAAIIGGALTVISFITYIRIIRKAQVEQQAFNKQVSQMGDKLDILQKEKQRLSLKLLSIEDVLKKYQ